MTTCSNFLCGKDLTGKIHHSGAGGKPLCCECSGHPYGSCQQVSISTAREKPSAVEPVITVNPTGPSKKNRESPITVQSIAVEHNKQEGIGGTGRQSPAIIKESSDMSKKGRPPKRLLVWQEVITEWIAEGYQIKQDPDGYRLCFGIEEATVTYKSLAEAKDYAELEEKYRLEEEALAIKYRKVIE